MVFKLFSTSLALDTEHSILYIWKSTDSSVETIWLLESTSWESLALKSAGLSELLIKNSFSINWALASAVKNNQPKRTICLIILNFNIKRLPIKINGFIEFLVKKVQKCQENKTYRPKILFSARSKSS